MGIADKLQLAKASTLALISMLIIIITVLTQGPRVPSEMKGKLRGSILVNSGIFQAIGVISFGAFGLISRHIQFTFAN